MSTTLTTELATLARDATGAWHVALVRPGREPHPDAWALPGGTVAPEEEPSGAAVRELAEATGIRLDTAELLPLGTYADPRPGACGHRVRFLYLAVVPELVSTTPGTDVDEARWWPLGSSRDLPRPPSLDHDVALRDVMRVGPRKPEPVVRRVVESDIPAVLSLHYAALRAAGTDAGPGPWDDDLDAIGTVYLDTGGEFLVATYGPAIVGMGALRAVDNTQAEVKRMRVLPRWQGRGVGRAVYQCLEARAHELGFERLVLDTPREQHDALHLYSSLGFTETGSTVVAGMPSRLLQKNLNETHLRGQHRRRF